MEKCSCLTCGKVFFLPPSRLKWGRGKYCSPRCQYKHIRENPKKNERVYVCPVCKKSFKKVVHKKVQNVYCSMKCVYKGITLGLTKRIIRRPYNCKRKQPRNCIICQKEYTYRKKTQRYCSTKCCDIHKRTLSLGKNNPAYKNGSSYDKRWWRGNDWETLRLEIYKRDSYHCQDCNIKCISKKSGIKSNSGKVIQCHHIESYKKKHNNDKGNLITLCLSCHLKRHGKEVKNGK